MQYMVRCKLRDTGPAPAGQQQQQLQPDSNQQQLQRTSSSSRNQPDSNSSEPAAARETNRTATPVNQQHWQGRLATAGQ
ncbi:hypothetical protein H5410_005188 [Solanum commersonii]|uniref:Uncharacterized protein n=1 Tax=Solanum commersonii TaxID=4109 RepID=A0A9J6A6H6_SOLCO|nr:hypothetical protein H5410_005188 [Solanum commersonii]